MTERTLEALRQLAERPGTEAEGILAREILGRHKDTIPEPPWQFDYESLMDSFRAGRISHDDALDAIAREARSPLPTNWRCACGRIYTIGSKCQDWRAHDRIQQEIRRKFLKGDRAYYNRHAYDPNTPCVVSGYVKPAPPNGDYPWAWISVKFDHLKGYRKIPIYSALGWHLSHEPLPSETKEQQDKLKELAR